MFVGNILCSCRRLPNLLQGNVPRSIVRSSLYTTRNIRSIPWENNSVMDSPDKIPTQHSTKRGLSTSSLGHSSVESTATNTSSTVSATELAKFKTLAPEWWKNDGEYIALKSLNKLRVSLIKELLCGDAAPHQPLSGMNILDVGCGGGILAEPLARLGANVTGIDPLQENIDAANTHRGEHTDLTSLSYTCTTVEELCRTHGESFDLVVASEVLEHVDNPEVFIQDCCTCVKPGGRMVVTTINRNVVSTALVKYAAEYLLRIVPAGTHDEEKFVEPGELVDMLREGGGMAGINFKGMFMNPMTFRWSWVPSLVMNYACYATKPQ